MMAGLNSCKIDHVVNRDKNILFGLLHKKFALKAWKELVLYTWNVLKFPPKLHEAMDQRASSVGVRRGAALDL